MVEPAPHTPIKYSPNSLGAGKKSPNLPTGQLSLQIPFYREIFFVLFLQKAIPLKRFFSHLKCTFFFCFVQSAIEIHLTTSRYRWGIQRFSKQEPVWMKNRWKMPVLWKRLEIKYFKGLKITRSYKYFVGEQLKEKKWPAILESRENAMLNVYYCCMDGYLTIVIFKYSGVVLGFFYVSKRLKWGSGKRAGFQVQTKVLTVS